jgi:hypothetical protein
MIQQIPCASDKRHETLLPGSYATLPNGDVRRISELLLESTNGKILARFGGGRGRHSVVEETKNLILRSE